MLRQAVVLVQGVQVLAVAGSAGPFLGGFDDGAFAPFVEGGDQLPVGAGGGHGLDIADPAVEVAAQADGVALEPEAGADGIAVGALRSAATAGEYWCQLSGWLAQLA